MPMFLITPPDAEGGHDCDLLVYASGPKLAVWRFMQTHGTYVGPADTLESAGDDLIEVNDVHDENSPEANTEDCYLCRELPNVYPSPTLTRIHRRSSTPKYDSRVVGWDECHFTFWQWRPYNTKSGIARDAYAAVMANQPAHELQKAADNTDGKTIVDIDITLPSNFDWRAAMHEFLMALPPIVPGKTNEEIDAGINNLLKDLGAEQ